MKTYQSELNQAMKMCVSENSLFVGQSVKFGGQKMFQTLSGVPDYQRIEMPIAEDMQAGFCTGLAMAGMLPICIFPRIDFALLALNQLVNHLDKMQDQPRVIIRTAIGAKYPLNAGLQHTQDHVRGFRNLLCSIPVYRLEEVDEIVPTYERALNRDGATILVEYAGMY